MHEYQVHRSSFISGHFLRFVFTSFSGWFMSAKMHVRLAGQRSLGENGPCGGKRSMVVFLLLCVLGLFLVILTNSSSSTFSQAKMSLGSTTTTCPTCPTLPKPIPPIRKRNDLGQLLSNEGHKTGVELGVQKGKYARELLSRWKDCTRYVLVDIWAPLANYDDEANVDAEQQELLFERALSETNRWKDIREICRNLTTECAKQYQHEKFDFVYVDARHDYKGVLVDIADWWPLINDGGIMAGHDFVTQMQGPQESGQNWTINYDGTVDATGRAVYGAVMDFFSDASFPDRYRQVSVTYAEGSWYTWIVRK